MRDQKILTALQDTTIKKSPKQSSKLSTEDKHFVNDGDTYRAESIEKSKKNHSFVRLAYGAGEWYIYTPHFDIHNDSKTISQTGVDLIKEFEAERLLKNDINLFEKQITELVKVQLTQNQFDALVSLSFDIGLGAFENSTLLEKLNNNDYSGASQEFTRWAYVGGQRLEHRRKAERELFISDLDREENEGDIKQERDAGSGFDVGFIDWNNFNCPVSKFFTVGEVTRYDKNRIPHTETLKQNIITLAKKLDIVREQWGSAIQVTSWYRPPSVNNRVGGVSNSQHLSGRAVDIYPSNRRLKELQDWLDKDAWYSRALGYGLPRGFVHLDLRTNPNGKGIRWNY